jgi:hypothetical protein
MGRLFSSVRNLLFAAALLREGKSPAQTLSRRSLPPAREDPVPKLPQQDWEFAQAMDRKALIVREVREDPLLGPTVADLLDKQDVGKHGFVTGRRLTDFYKDLTEKGVRLTQAQWERLWQLSFGPSITVLDFVKAVRRGVDINAALDLGYDRTSEVFGGITDRDSFRLGEADHNKDGVIQGLGNGPLDETEAADAFYRMVCWSRPKTDCVVTVVSPADDLTFEGYLYEQMREAAGMPPSLRASAPVEEVKGGSLAARVAPLAARGARLTSLAHRNAIDFEKVGIYAGSTSKFAKMSDAEKLNWLAGRNSLEQWADPMPQWATRREPIPANPGPIHWTDRAPKFKDCLWVMDVLREAYHQAGADARWQQIEAAVRKDDLRGTTLLAQLQKDGWVGIFWMPDVRNPVASEKYQVQQHHDAAKRAAKGDFFGLRIVDAIVNYRLAGTEGYLSSDLERLARVPFGVAAARDGDHMAVVVNNDMYEVHRDLMPDERRLLERTEGLQKFDWSSGALVVPGESWNRRLTAKELKEKINQKPGAAER